MAVLTRAELDVLVRERLESDPGFRAVLVADPRAAVSQLAGADLPDEVTVTVHEESLTEIHLVLPAPVAGDGEISEADLDLVAGGAFWANSADQQPFGPTIR